MPRLSIVLTKEQNDKLDKYLPWGTKQPIMSALVDNLNDSLERHGPKLLGLIINGDFNSVTKEVRRED